MGPGSEWTSRSAGPRRPGGGRAGGRQRARFPTGLETRDIQILQALSEGASASAVGRRLGISERTVRRRMVAVCAQLGAKNVVEAVAIAVRWDLLE